MKAVVADFPPHWLAERMRTGAHQFDEMWAGVLHIPPVQTTGQQALNGELAAYLKRRWAKPARGRACYQVNLTTPDDEPQWTKNYRIPDIVLLSRDRLSIDKNEYMVGAPLVVVEIRSPDDETYEKLPFYAGLGVPEVWVFDRDTKAVELRTLAAGPAYDLLPPGPGGWHHSPATGVEFRQARPGKVVVRVNDDDATAEELPDS